MNRTQNILGINGWIERSHDASACLLQGNRIVAMTEEERFTRKRYAYDSLPTLAIASCLSTAEVDVDEIDYVAIGWDLPFWYKSRKIPFKYTEREFLKLLFPSHIFRYSKLPKLVFIPHHLAHAASAYRVSGFRETLILVLDGQGEEGSGLMAYGKDGHIKPLSKFPIPYSLGYLYEAVSKFIGFKTSDVGKVMGLSGYGKCKYLFENIKLTPEGYKILGFPPKIKPDGIRLDEQEIVTDLWTGYMEKGYGPPNTKDIKLDILRQSLKTEIKLSGFYKDLTASLQTKLEEIVLHLVTLLVKRTGCRKLVLAGGVGLNCVVNGRLAASGAVDDIFIQPVANDAGVSLGAALELAHRLGIDFSSQMSHVYFGPSFSNNKIESVFRRFGLKYRRSADISREAAGLLAEGKVVAWFQGRMEAGPRALGARSILANPCIPRMKKIVNRIKSREPWRPLAPSILEEKQKEFFEKSVHSPFMLQSHLVRFDKRKYIPAVVHKDGTTRYQSVKKGSNPKYHELIRDFENITGVPLILNTSFNTEGEPIVCTPYDAIKTFYSSPIDCLAIGDLLVGK